MRFKTFICIYLLLFIVILFCSSMASADGVRIDFTSGDIPDNIDSITLWERLEAGRIARVENIPPGQTFVEYRDDPPAECRTFYITTIRGGVESQPSNPVGWCPETTLPVQITRPGTVTINIEILDTTPANAN